MSDVDAQIIAEELGRPITNYVRVPHRSGWTLKAFHETGYFWVREHRGLWVTLRRWHGTPMSAIETGEIVTVSLPRFWWFHLRIWWARRHPEIPKATVRR